MSKSSDALRAEIAATPRSIERDEALRVVRSYFSSYDTDDPEQRVVLFADRFIFEDPAGVRRASDRETLRAFYAQLSDGGYRLRFEEKRAIVIGDFCLIEAAASVTVGDSQPSSLYLFIVFRTNRAGLIEEFRTYFDEHCVHDLIT